MGLMDEEDKVVAIIQVPIEIKEGDLSSVACGFLPWENNGSGHWAEISKSKMKGIKPSSEYASDAFAAGTLNFKVIDSDEKKEYILTRAMLLQAIVKWCGVRGRLFEAGDVDAGDSDDILQLAVLGEIVYG